MWSLSRASAIIGRWLVADGNGHGVTLVSAWSHEPWGRWRWWWPGPYQRQQSVTLQLASRSRRKRNKVEGPVRWWRGGCVWWSRRLTPIHSRPATGVSVPVSRPSPRTGQRHYCQVLLDPFSLLSSIGRKTVRKSENLVIHLCCWTLPVSDSWKKIKTVKIRLPWSYLL